MSLPIAESHLDLITRPIHGVLTTLMPDGQPHRSHVRCERELAAIVENKMIGRVNAQQVELFAHGCAQRGKLGFIQ